MNSYIRLLRKASFESLVQLCDQRGLQVFAPVRKEDKTTEFARIRTGQEMSTDHVLTRLSAKEYVFPRTEKLFSYVKKHGEVDIANFHYEGIPQRVVFGLRPCDAVGMIALGKIFQQEPKDAIFQARMDKTTLVSISCTRSDAACFCTSVGIGPGDTRGSDMQLTPMENGDYLAEILTEKGQALVDLNAALFEPLPQDFSVTKEQLLVQPDPIFDGSLAYKKLNEQFESAVFEEQALACLGCGTCAFVCPTCGCFDIQDESRGSSGVRLRIWDSCGLKQFTLHTSGHNPRDTQGKRWRQRLMHKFSYMPERLDVSGCVGCGRCTRACPVSMSISQSIKQIIED